MNLEELWLGQRAADPSPAEQGIGFAICVDIRQGLVPADIEGSHSQGVRAARSGDLSIGRHLLLLTGGGPAPHEEELCAQQADSFGAIRKGTRDIAQGTHVGQYKDALAIDRDRWAATHDTLGVARVQKVLAAGGEGLALLSIWAHPENAALPVDPHPRALVESV